MTNHNDLNTPTGQQENTQLLAVLTRIAEALEKQNEQLSDLTSAVCGVSMRIEDVGTWLS